MKLKDIPAYLGIPAAELARRMGVGKSALGNYTTGIKGRPSQFVQKALDASGLLREEIIFPDRFGRPDGRNPEHAEYWLNVAMEAIREAGERGADVGRIIEACRDAGEGMKNDI